MKPRPDFGRLERAIHEAVLALPATACQNSDAAVRRACHELVLLLVHTQERVRDLRDLFGTPTKRTP